MNFNYRSLIPTSSSLSPYIYIYILYIYILFAIRLFTLIQGIVGIFNVLEIAWSIYLCYHLLSAPVISQSMNEVINYLLMMPIGACLGLGDYLWWLRNYNLPHRWLPLLFIAEGILQFILVT